MQKSILFIAIAALSGCDVTSELYQSNYHQPFMQINSGMVLQISDSETAKMYGPDKCILSSDLGVPLTRIGCTSLKDGEVSVTFAQDGKVWEEIIKIVVENEKYRIVRSNDFELRDPATSI